MKKKPFNCEASIEAAVGALRKKFGDGVNKGLLKQIKKAHGSAAGFKGSRVYLDELIPFLQAEIAKTAGAPAGSSPTLDKYTLECQKLVEQITDIKEERDIRQGKFVERSTVVASNRRMAIQLRKLLAKLETEMPGNVAGKDMAEARAYGARLYDETLRVVQSWEDEWAE